MINPYQMALLEAEIGKKRLEHSQRVSQTASSINDTIGLNPIWVQTSAILHDCGRLKDKDQISVRLKRYGIVLDSQTQDSPQLQHAVLGRFLAQYQYGIQEAAVLNAIRYHTTARAGMSPLEKIIYVADAIEFGRDYDGVDRLRYLAHNQLNQAVYEVIKQTIDFVKQNHQFVHTQSIQAAEYYKKYKEDLFE